MDLAPADGTLARDDVRGTQTLFSQTMGLVAVTTGLFALVTIFANIPNGALIYALAGLGIFAALTVVDFQRLRLTSDESTAPMIAASIFLDGLNVFLFFLQIFHRRSS